MRIWAMVAVCALMAGCTLAGPDQLDVIDVPAAEGNPVTGDAIAVTSLDAPAVADAAKPADVAKPVAAGAATAVPAATEAVAKPFEAAKPAEGVTPAEVAAAPEAAAEAPAPVMSPQEQACIKTGGSWVTTGKSGARACVKTTRDSGKHCTKASQCEGACLARSNTCSPVTPLFGCNDILQDNGVMVTLCID